MPGMGATGVTGWLGCVAVGLCALAWPASAAGGTKLWDLGKKVDENAPTTFIMFCMVVGISVVVESAKHAAESRIKDKYRRQSMQAIYTELMMVGVVSALLILSAELGLLDVRIGCDDSSGSATYTAAPGGTLAPTTAAPSIGSLMGSAISSASSSGSEPCGLGFDLILFEYAHLVLFFMGLAYCAFILIAFMQRDSLCKTMRHLQQTTLHDWYEKGNPPDSVLGVMGFSFWDEGNWATALLTMRAALIQEHGERMQTLCHPERMRLRKEIMKYRGQPIPSDLPSPNEVAFEFDIARFSYIAMSEVLLELLHIPPIAWLFVLVIAAANLIHKAGLALADALMITSVFGPLLAIFLLWRISVHFTYITQRASGHPHLPKYEFYGAKGDKGTRFKVDPRKKKEGIAWSLPGGEDPWAVLTGCCEDGSTFDSLDPLDPVALERQIQVVLLTSCFYVGQLAMLTKLIFADLGVVGVIAWLLPIPPLVWWLPRAVIVYALTHRTKEPPDSWLIYALKRTDDPNSEADVHTKFHSNEEEEALVEDAFRNPRKPPVRAAAGPVSPGLTQERLVMYDKRVGRPYVPPHGTAPLAAVAHPGVGGVSPRAGGMPSSDSAYVPYHARQTQQMYGAPGNARGVRHANHPTVPPPSVRVNIFD